MKLSALVCALLFSVTCFAASPTVGESFNTQAAPSDLHLENGVSVHLNAGSTGTIFGDHALLEQGSAHLSNFKGYPVKIGQLSIESETPNTQAAIRVQQNTVEVASLGGDLEISTGGALLTRVVSGTRMSFQNTGATAAPRGHGPRHWSDTKTWVVVLVSVSAAALAIGLTAAAQGKSPF
jgi:hypothetical protein